jgi:hypothetical protein
MLVHIEPQATGEPVNRALQIAVVKGHQTPAGIAQQVMMMRAGWVDQLVTRHVLPQLQSCNQPPILKQIEDSIDARASHTALAYTQPVFDLKGAERAGLLGQQVDDRVSRTTLTMPSLVEHCASVLGPLRCTCR